MRHYKDFGAGGRKASYLVRATIQRLLCVSLCSRWRDRVAPQEECHKRWAALRYECDQIVYQPLATILVRHWSMSYSTPSSKGEHQTLPPPHPHCAAVLLRVEAIKVNDLKAGSVVQDNTALVASHPPATNPKEGGLHKAQNVLAPPPPSPGEMGGHTLSLLTWGGVLNIMRFYCNSQAL